MMVTLGAWLMALATCRVSVVEPRREEDLEEGLVVVLAPVFVGSPVACV